MKIKNIENGLKLHLGCGLDKLSGYINCDIDERVNPDMLVDFEKKLPFKDDSVIKVYSKNTFEHIRNVIQIMNELHRICKNGAVINIRVPFYSSYAYCSSIEHVTRFTPDTFSCFSHLFDIKFKLKLFVMGKKGLLGIFQKFIDSFINKHTYFYCRALSNILPCSEIEYFIKVIKYN